MKRIASFLVLLLLASNVARGDSMTTGGDRVLENPTSGAAIKTRVNIGGTKTDVLSVSGAAGGPVTVGANPVATFANLITNLYTLDMGKLATSETGTSILRLHGGTGGTAATGRSSALYIDPSSRGLDINTWNDVKFYINGNTEGPLNGAVTISNATPAVLTATAHGLVAGDRVFLETNGTLPTGFTAGTAYFVIATGLTTNTFELAGSVGGTAINTSSAGSGSHSFLSSTSGGALGMTLNTSGLSVDLGADTGKTVGSALSIGASSATFTSSTDVVPYFLNNIVPQDTTTTVRAQYAGQWAAAGFWGIGVDGTASPSIGIGGIATNGKMSSPYIATNSARTTLNGYFTGSAAAGVGGCTTTPCTLTDPFGMFSSVSRSATGTYSMNFTASFWNAAPVCQVTNSRGSSIYCNVNTSSLSTTAYPVSCYVSNTAALVDTGFFITCQGPRN
jgi:hypothetical protein